MYRFLVHKAIKDEGSYASTDSMTQTIARLQYITRGCVLIEGHRLHRYEFVLLNGVNPSSPGKGQSFEELYKLVDNTKVADKIGTTSMESLFQAYGLVQYHAEDGQVIPDVVWSDSTKSSLSVKNTIVSRCHIVNAVHNAIKRLDSLLDKLTLSDFPDLKYIPQDIQDDPENSERGYSFLNHPGNVDLLAGFEKLVVHFVSKSDYMDGNRFDRLKCENWLAMADEALELLCFVIHTTCGQPGRATELAILLLRNTIESRRHFFFHMNRLVIRPTYNKTDSKTQKGKFILRFLDPQVRLLFIRFVAFVRPLEMYVL